MRSGGLEPGPEPGGGGDMGAAAGISKQVPRWRLLWLLPVLAQAPEGGGEGGEKSETHVRTGRQGVSGRCRCRAGSTYWRALKRKTDVGARTPPSPFLPTLLTPSPFSASLSLPLSIRPPLPPSPYPSPAPPLPPLPCASPLPPSAPSPSLPSLSQSRPRSSWSTSAPVADSSCLALRSFPAASWQRPNSLLWGGVGDARGWWSRRVRR